MKMIRLEEITSTKFPAGRQTRVMIGATSPIQAENFVMGCVEIEPGGKVPLHAHVQEEVYFIVKGSGSMTVGKEKKAIHEGTAIYIPPHDQHELINDSDSPMTMVFVYSPAGIVSHWEEEKKGLLK